MIKKAYIKKKVNGEEYANINTGETLGSEMELSSINIPTEKVIISSDEYIIIDSKAKKYVESVFNNAECGRIFQMADMVYGCYNLVCNKRTPHTTKTLSKELDYTRSRMSTFMKKLYQNSIISYIKGYKDGKEYTYIMLNPTLARKSKVFHQECVAVFEDLSKKNIITNGN